MGQLLGFFHSDDSDGIFDIDLQMRQDWLVVAPSSKMYIASSVFFIKTEEKMVLSQIACHTF